MTAYSGGKQVFLDFRRKMRVFFEAVGFEQLLRSTADFSASFGRQCSRQVTLARGRQDGNDDLSLVLRTFRNFQRSNDCRAGRDAAKNAFFLADTSRHGKRIVVGNFDGFSDLRIAVGIFQVEIVRNEPGARSLNLVRAGFEFFSGESLRNDRRIRRLDRNGLKLRLALLDHL